MRALERPISPINRSHHDGCWRDPADAAVTRGYCGKSLNVHRDPPIGTFAMLGSCGRALSLFRSPLVTVTYWVPFCCQVTGWPTIPDDVWNRHKISPVSASTAMTSPVRVPVNTSPPAVTSVPAQFGLLKPVCHLASPVVGLMAFKYPRGSGSGKMFVVLIVLPPERPPAARLSFLNSASGSGSYSTPMFALLTYMSPVKGL